MKSLEYEFYVSDVKYSADIEYESPSVWSVTELRGPMGDIPSFEPLFQQLLEHLESDPNLIAEAIENDRD